MRLSGKMTVRVNDDAQVVIEQESGFGGMLSIEPIVLSRAESLRIAEQVQEARRIEDEPAHDPEKPRDVVTGDGETIHVECYPPDMWNGFRARWNCLWCVGRDMFVAPTGENGGIGFWDYEPTDAEVLAEYESWRTEAAEKR